MNLTTPPTRPTVIRNAKSIELYGGGVLDFDIECRPLGWLGGDRVHQEPTAIASAWIVDGQPKDMQVLLLNKRNGSDLRMLREFRKRYDKADLVTGHYIRGFDLPQLNGAMIEQGLEPLSRKMTHDTYGDLVKHAGLSKSQENLGSMLGIEAPKVKMNMTMWRKANRLTNEGFALTYQRVAGDVVQHVEMRRVLMERNLLKAPRWWTP
jgi:hypothetical protein